jgi:hypothetical protein
VKAVRFPGAIAVLGVVLLAACGRDAPTGPGEGAPGRIGLRLTFPETETGRSLDSLSFSVYAGSREIAGPEFVEFGRSFSVALQVPPGSDRVAVVRAFGESSSLGAGTILLGVSDPFSVTGGDTIAVSVALRDFVTFFHETQGSFVGSARLSWDGVAGATSYTVREDVVGGPPVLRNAADTTITVAANATGSPSRTFRVRANSPYATGAWSFPVTIEIVPETEPGDGWTVLHDGSGTGPGARFLHMSAWHEPDRTLYVFGGILGTEVVTDSLLWAYSAASNEWTAVSAGSAGGPSSWGYGSMAVSEDGNFIYIFGGYNGFTSSALDLWRFDLTARRWTLLEPQVQAEEAGLPFEASESSHLWAPIEAAGELRLFVAATSEVWTYSLGQRVWIAPGRLSLLPPPREDAPALSYDRESQSLFVFGGTIIEGFRPDSTLWVYSENQRTWSVRPVQAESTADPKIFASGVAIDDGRFFVLGGFAPYFVPLERGLLEYRPAGSSWTGHAVPGNLYAAIRPTVVYDNAGGRLIVFGGTSLKESAQVWGWEID